MTAHAIDTGLTRPQERVLAAIAEYWRDNGIPPTIRDLMRAVGSSSSSTVHRAVIGLEAAGLITHQPGTTRSIRLVVEAGNVGADVPC